MPINPGKLERIKSDMIPIFIKKRIDFNIGLFLFTKKTIFYREWGFIDRTILK